MLLRRSPSPSRRRWGSTPCVKNGRRSGASRPIEGRRSKDLTGDEASARKSRDDRLRVRPRSQARRRRPSTRSSDPCGCSPRPGARQSIERARSSHPQSHGRRPRTRSQSRCARPSLRPRRMRSRRSCSSSRRCPASCRSILADTWRAGRPMPTRRRDQSRWSNLSRGPLVEPTRTTTEQRTRPFIRRDLVRLKSVNSGVCCAPNGHSAMRAPHCPQ